jgi:septum formation protein
MSDPRVILASASPRRRRLIGWLGLPVSVTSADTPEDLSAPLPAAELAASLAAEKALAVRDDHEIGTLILAFDTVVVADGVILGKPADHDDARRMLRTLAGREHEVVTGVAILSAGAEDPDTIAVTTRVTMRDLDHDAIESWLDHGEALGCAGAYNIEHHLASVSDDQCYQNVAGLPLCHVYAELASGRAGRVPDGLQSPVATCDTALGRICTLGPRVCGRADAAPGAVS